MEPVSNSCVEKTKTEATFPAEIYIYYLLLETI